MLKKYFLLLFFSAFLVIPAFAQDAPTVVIVVRHAEKQAVDPKMNPDPSLSEVGAKRAQDLANAVHDASVSAIYTTQFKRTRETAAPLAEKSKIPVIPIEATRENMSNYSALLAKEILAKHAGKTVLVIGHSNTVPQIVEALGGKLPPPVDDATEFDRLYVVILPKSGAAKVVAGRYGAPK